MMKIQPRTTNVRPDNATLVYSFNLFKNRRAFWALNGGGIALLILFGMLFSWVVSLIRPSIAFELAISSANALFVCLSLLGIAAGQMVLHELVHGVFIWLFTRSRPTFGFRGWYAYAAAPGWFFSRGQYLVVLLAPFVLLSVLGLILLTIVSQRIALMTILLAAVLNAASSVSDLWITLLIIRERRPIVIEDLGDGMNFYTLN
jgi:energy-coupling factor transporter transmembrane protein EcfT